MPAGCCTRPMGKEIGSRTFRPPGIAMAMSRYGKIKPVLSDYDWIRT
jgi:hypothetical protein